MQLFNVSKVPLFCDGVQHKTEARRGETVKVIVLTLRLAPFEKKLARAMPIGELADTLFAINGPKPRAVRRAEFDPPTERQLLRVFAAPDVPEPSIAFDQAKVGKLVSRMTKDRTAHDLHFTATFGPAGRRELEYAQEWLFSQRFVTFDEAEPGMFDDPEEGSDAPADETPAGEKFEFETQSDGAPVEPRAPARSRPQSRRRSARKPAARPKQRRRHA